MNTVDMNMEKIMAAVNTHLLESENCDYYSDETSRRIDSLIERLDSLTCIDREFNVQFTNNFYDTVNEAAYEAFDNGLRIGLSLLRSLLTAETPEIHILHNNPPKRKPRIAPLSGTINSNHAFMEYMSDAVTKLTEYEKGQIQSRTEYMIENHREENDKLF